MPNVAQIDETLLRDSLPAGQLPAKILQRLLEQYAHTKTDAIFGPSRAAAVIPLEDRLLIAKTGASTFVADDIGHRAAHLNANAVACAGGEPKWFMATVLLPEHEMDAIFVEQIFQQITRACNALKISWNGGHAEMTAAVTQPIVIGMLLGEAPLSRRYGADQIQPGDHILLTKGLAVDATAIIGRAKAAALAEIFEADFAKQCEAFLQAPGLSVLPEARIAWQKPGVHALHPAATGGLANAVHELVKEENFGVELEVSQIPLFPETKLLCEQFGLDPIGLMASGAMLVVGEEQACAEVLQAYQAASIPAALIGRILPEGEGRWLIDDTERHPLALFPRDEIFRVL